MALFRSGRTTGTKRKNCQNNECPISYKSAAIRAKSLADFPTELLVGIFRNISDIGDASRSELVCKAFRNVCWHAAKISLTLIINLETGELNLGTNKRISVARRDTVLSKLLEKICFLKKLKIQVLESPSYHVDQKRTDIMRTIFGFDCKFAGQVREVQLSDTFLSSPYTPHLMLSFSEKLEKLTFSGPYLDMDESDIDSVLVAVGRCQKLKTLTLSEGFLFEKLCSGVFQDVLDCPKFTIFDLENAHFEDEPSSLLKIFDTMDMESHKSNISPEFTLKLRLNYSGGFAGECDGINFRFADFFEALKSEIVPQTGYQFLRNLSVKALLDDDDDNEFAFEKEEDFSEGFSSLFYVFPALVYCKTVFELWFDVVPVIDAFLSHCMDSEKQCMTLELHFENAEIEDLFGVWDELRKRYAFGTLVQIFQHNKIVLTEQEHYVVVIQLND